MNGTLVLLEGENCKKILGTDGIPRKNGNTERLVGAILDDASERGADTVSYKLAKTKSLFGNCLMTAPIDGA